MSTTTLRLEDELKARIAAAAQREGKTPHAFIVDAIAKTVEQAEVEAAHDRLADTRWAKLLATGETVDWDEAKAWATRRANGEPARRPAVRRLAR